MCSLQLSSFHSWTQTINIFLLIVCLITYVCYPFHLLSSLCVKTHLSYVSVSLPLLFCFGGVLVLLSGGFRSPDCVIVSAERTTDAYVKRYRLRNDSVCHLPPLTLCPLWPAKMIITLFHRPRPAVQNMTGSRASAAHTYIYK